MRNAFFVACCLVLGCVLTSQAVVIHWSTDSVPSGTTSATLVYVSSGVPPTYTDGTLSNGSTVGDAVTGLAITPMGIGEQSATHAAQSQGAYYVVLFDASGNFSYSGTSIAYNDTTFITTDEMAPSSAVFNAAGGSGFSVWAPVPEPSVAMLLVAGAAMAALRRRKRA